MAGRSDSNPDDPTPRFQPSQGEILASIDSVVHAYVRVLYKRRWTAVTALLGVVITVAVFTYTATPMYESTMRLLVEVDDPNIVDFRPVIDDGGQRPDYLQTQFSILESRSLAFNTIQALGLWKHPQFGGAAQTTPAAPSLMTKVSQWFGGTPAAPTTPPAVNETLAQARAVDRFQGSLRIEPVRLSRIVDVSYRSSDPKLAADVLNTLASEYIKQTIDIRFAASKVATDFLAERLAEYRKKVEESDIKLQQYREANNAVAQEDRENTVDQELEDLNSAVTAAKTQLISKEVLYRQLMAIRNDREALDTFPGVLANTYIQQLKTELAALQRQHQQMSETLAAKHPELIRVTNTIEVAEKRLEGEIAKLVQSVRNDYEASRTHEANLVAALDAQKREALGMKRIGIEFAVLQREADSNREIYQSLLKRAQETGVSGDLRTSNVRVVDRAEVPRSPTSPNRQLNMILGVLGGLVLALGLVLGFEALDNRIKTPKELEDALGVPFLGMVPIVTGDQVLDAPLTSSQPPGFTEALRIIRTNVLFATPEASVRTLVVTSTVPGEGKSTVAANIAAGLAQAGLRVLIIDADMRRPRLHQMFGGALEPGLSNVLVGAAKVSDAVRSTTLGGLRYLTAGRVPPNPTELLAAPRFNELLRAFEQHFDWVIIDSPPVMPVADAAVAAHVASGVLFVVGTEMVSRASARLAIERLRHAHARCIGAVLNRVDLAHHAYYYSQYYSATYARYYTPTAG